MQSAKLLRASAPLLTKAIRPAAQPIRLAVIATTLQTSSYHNSVRTRPRTQQSQQWHPSTFSKSQRRTIFIQTENTPNPDSLKFLPNHRILPENIKTPFIEYMNPRSTISPPYPSPLAAQLMAIDGVTSVFYGTDFITVTKSSDAEWAHIRPEVFSLITESITSGQTIVNVSERKEGEAGAEAEEEDSLAYNENDSEVVGMIKELLETRIRPAIQEDGGDIEFRGFEDGYVKLKLRGACRTCDSSTVTLKNGIEGMLMHYVSAIPVFCHLQEEKERRHAYIEKTDRGSQGRKPSPRPRGRDCAGRVPEV
jgi:Fe-S cluster biogenesis protein NfuA